MNAQQDAISFCWWNLHDFAHFDPNLASDSRRPKRDIDFEAKRDRILAALRELFAGGYPDLLAVCEITREAATDLSQRMGTAFDIAVAPTYPHDDGFQVAVIFRKDIGFSADTPLLAEDVSEETRPMIAVRFRRGDTVIRFVACHWTSFDSPQSRKMRRRLADYISRDTYEFLQPNNQAGPLNHHTVILGDLNIEPTSPIFEEDLAAFRDHDSSRWVHWRDRNQRRVRL